MLLDHDGLNKTWTDGVSQSDYLGELGDFEEDDLTVHNEFALYRLHKLIGGTSHTKMDLSKNRRGADCTSSHNDLTGMFGEADESNENEDNNDTGDDDSEEVRVVGKLSFNYFRERLIEHFDILFKNKKIVWPTRNKATRKSNRVVQEMMNQQES